MRANLADLAESKWIGYYIAAVALTIAVVFSFVIYPAMAKTHHLVLDSDQYGQLAYGLWKNHSLSFFPDPDPTVGRGPAYPMFEAGLLILTRGWYPQSIQLGQCLLVALTCMLVFAVSESLWNRKIAILTAGLTAIHPLVIWFSSRIWIETLSTFIFTLLIAASLALDRKPTVWRSIALGLVIGVGALCKSTFLPLILLLPALMFFYMKKRVPWRLTLPMVLAAMMVIAPWTARNWRLTGRFIPVHAMTGVNILYGDYMTKYFSTYGFSLPKLAGVATLRLGEISRSLPGGLPRHEMELMKDSYAMKECLATYKRNPGFLVYRTAIQALLFWTLGETATKSLVISLMQVPLLFAFIWAWYLIWRRGQMRSIMGVHLILMFAYFALHLPFHTQNRYSVVLIPTMLLYATGAIFGPMTRSSKKEDGGRRT